MKKQHLVGLGLATALAAAGTLTACGSSASTTDDARPAASSTSSAPSISSAPGSPADLTLVPGAAGPVEVGMSAAEATATGLLRADVPDSVAGCGVHPLAWTRSFAKTFDVQALPDGDVASIGVHRAGPTTETGLGIGSSYADVTAANAGARTVGAGYGQTGVLVREAGGDGWIGYLFDAEPRAIRATDRVSFIELTRGEKPSLMRDGC